MGLTVVKGRGISATDRAGTPRVGLVSESFAARAWPGRDPLGQRLGSRMTRDTNAITVIGVVEEAKVTSISGTNPFVLYLPLEQNWPGEGEVLVVKASGSLEQIVTPIRRLVHEIEPRAAIGRVTTMDLAVSGAMSEPLRLRFFLTCSAAGAGAGGRRSLLGGVLLGGPPAQRVRGPHGARRDLGPGVEPGGGPGAGAGRRGNRHRHRRLYRAGRGGGAFPLRRGRHRSAQYRAGRAGPAGIGHDRGAGPGLAGRAGESRRSRSSRNDGFSAGFRAMPGVEDSLPTRTAFMRGKILQYNGNDGSGLIMADGQQYPFAIAVWKSETAPIVGKTVEIVLVDGRAQAVTLVG
jgi:hypothetical protein